MIMTQDDILCDAGTADYALTRNSILFMKKNVKIKPIAETIPIRFSVRFQTHSIPKKNHLFNSFS